MAISKIYNASPAIDADKVDGKHASDLVLKSGDTMSGDLIIDKTDGKLAHQISLSSKF